MHVYVIVGTFFDQLAASPVVGAATSFYRAQEIVNQRLSRLSPHFEHLNLPDHDASVIRSTVLGNIKFNMERFEV